MMVTNNISFLVIMAVAFLLGAAVTMFCFRLKSWNDEKAKEVKEDKGDKEDDL